MAYMQSHSPSQQQWASTSTPRRLPSLQASTRCISMLSDCNESERPLSMDDTCDESIQADVPTRFSSTAWGSKAAFLLEASASQATASPRRSNQRRRTPSGQWWTHVTTLLFALVLLASSSSTVAAANYTSLTGTWSSGAGHVMTGLDFFNPITKNFTIPASGGIAYSFIDDLDGGGHFETSTFAFTSNPSSNRCFNATLTWQHGTYTVNANGSLSLTPYEPDGVVQVMDPCGATSIAQYSYSEFELIPYWYNYIEADTGFGTDGQTLEAYAMGMYNNNGTGGLGARKNIMNLVARPPTMLPTEQLHEEVLNAESA